jgi:hypothetical protein
VRALRLLTEFLEASMAECSGTTVGFGGQERERPIFLAYTSQSAVQVCCTVADGKPAVLLTLLKKNTARLEKKFGR